MKVEFLKKFSRDLEKIKQPRDRKAIINLIRQVKTVSQLEEVPGVKKLVGYDDAFRVRSGNYRVGVFVNGDVVQFARVAHRKDIYKIFP